jgi:hypothetical protein
MSNAGWVKAHRSFMGWEWFRKGHHFKVMMALVFKANYEPKTYQGALIKRGELIIGRELFAAELGLSVQQLRTVLSNLESTGEITIKTSIKGTIIQVVRYEDYQDQTSKPTSKSTIDVTSKPTSEVTTPKKQEARRKNTTPTTTPSASEGELFGNVDKPSTPATPKKKAFVPPTKEEFIAYAVEKLPTLNPEWNEERSTRCAAHRFDTYVDQDWHDGNGKPIKNWKTKSITAMKYDSPKNFGGNPQFFAQQRKIAAEQSNACG